MSNSNLREKIQPWMELPNVWKTESAFLAYIRGGIRRSLWNRSPVKIEFINRNRYKIESTNPKLKGRLVWGGTCALTGEVFQLKDLEVDHISGNHSLKSLDDIQKFIEGIVLVSVKDLQFVSKEAHKVKSYAERMGISFEDAKAIKQAIEFEKKGVKKVVAFLKENGYNAGSNADKRRDQLIEHFKKVKP